MIEIEHVQTKGSSLRGTVQLAGGTRSVTSSVSKRMTEETSLGFDNAEVYKEFASNMESVKTQIVTLLNESKAQGKTIAGYGASVGVTTLLYYYGLSDILEYLLDDNPSRHGLFSPGRHIPVLPSQTIYERNPDYVLILAWQYEDPIL